MHMLQANSVVSRQCLEYSPAEFGLCSVSSFGQSAGSSLLDQRLLQLHVVQLNLEHLLLPPKPLTILGKSVDIRTAVRTLKLRFRRYSVDSRRCAISLIRAAAVWQRVLVLVVEGLEEEVDDDVVAPIDDDDVVVDHQWIL
jgi:hypothetical protein